MSHGREEPLLCFFLCLFVDICFPDKVVDMEADKKVGMVADMEVGKMADIEVDMVAEINIDIDIKINMEILFGERVGHRLTWLAHLLSVASLLCYQCLKRRFSPMLLLLLVDTEILTQDPFKMLKIVFRQFL